MKRRIFSFIFISLFAACGSPASAVSPIQKTEKFIEYYLQPSVMEAEIGAGPGTKPSDWL